MFRLTGATPANTELAATATVANDTAVFMLSVGMGDGRMS